MRRSSFFLVVLLVACSPKTDDVEIVTTRARNALDVEEYRRALLACKADGVDAGSRRAYEACAARADKKYGYDGGAP